ncbi:hypothetical protein BD324DRAFT_612042 [Kockovaella imperatae]|uniref:FK506-binding protein n=1 Tax=Kockovaella imperatae TaxID=4999 RepID=A0A1Y1UTA8_9TREE|nr:hypothetical protein BD324DRAFT_612042 [Kockovaella imperatae]ORX40764.1 hypothetical protein BD324DRAFT_612042 [Kockovaella imperatae]
MAVKRSLWSLTLLPGERTPLFVQRDFVLTNAALGEELRSETGRSIVKVTHQPIPASLFNDDSESDEDEDEDEEESEDEFELDEVEGFKLTPKKGKANGAAAEDEEEEDDEEEDNEEEEDDEVDGELSEDSEMDSDYSDSEEGLEQTNVLCSLLAGRVEQATLNLTFCEGDVVVFEVTGENSVHLMGNYVIQPEPDLSDSEIDSEYDSDELYDGPDDFDELYGSEDEDMEDEPEATIEEIVEKVVEKPSKKVAAAKEEKPKAKAVEATETKKRKAEEIESPAPKAATTTPAASTEGLSKAQKKKLAKKAKLEGATAAAPTPAAAAPTANGNANKKRTLPSGLIIEDIKNGDGPVAKAGKRLGMRYIGKLENGKQFDSNTAGKPFTFVLGRNEVIKGWEEGLKGMAVGGERRLTIPPAMAYGSQKLPGIPKNSTLKFDVKLVSVN